MRNYFLSALCVLGLGWSMAQVTNPTMGLMKASGSSTQSTTGHHQGSFVVNAERIGDVAPTTLNLDYVPVFNGTIGADGVNDGQDLIFDSGPFFNVAGPPALSVLQSNLGLSTFGAGAQKTAGNSVADDFTLTASTDVSSFDFYVYQTGTNPPSITGVYLRIWNGTPGASGSAVVWSDLNTNLIGSVSDTNVRRVLDTSTGDTSRKIQKVSATTTGLTLAAGSYWVEASFEGSGSSGPWAVPITITGQATTGNAMQNVNGTWGNLVDSGNPQGIPFQINGTQGGPFPAPYCTVSGNGNVEPITKVTFAGISNPSSALTSSPSHEDFTAIIGNVNTDTSYTMEVEGNTDGSWTNYITAWIDWNQDGTFDEASERYNIGTIVNSTGLDGKKATASISVPAGALEGNTRMRVMKKFGAYPTNACTSGSSFGQTEDYTIHVTGGSTPSDDCSLIYAGNNFEDGIGPNSTYPLAHDLVIPTNKNMTINQITYSIGLDSASTPVTSTEVKFYQNNPAGGPGTQVGATMNIVPTSVVLGGTDGSTSYYTVTLDLPTPITLSGNASGETIYWMGLLSTTTSGASWWEVNSTLSTPNQGYAFINGAWSSFTALGINPPFDGVFSLFGECEDIDDEPEPGDPCDIDFAISLDNGTGNTQTLLFADDFIIANGTSMSIDKVTLRIINNVNQITTLSFYEDAGGQPAATPLQTFSNLTPDSQTVVGNNFGFNFYDVVVSLPAAVELEEGTYWIAFSNSIGTDGGTSYWAITNSGIGAPGKYSADSGATWTTNTNAFNFSFKLEGECEGEPDEPEPGEGPCDSKVVMDCGVQYTAQLVPNAGEWVNYTGVTWSYTGSEKVFEFTAPVTGTYVFDVDEGVADADFIVMDACSNTANNLIGGYWTGFGSESMTLTEGQTIFVIADLYSGASSATTVSIRVNCPQDTSNMNCEDHFVESAGFTDGYFFTNELAFDIPVGNNGFDVYGVELNVFVEDSTDLDFIYTLYSDNGGLPGTEITSAIGNVMSSELAGSAFGYDIYTYVVSFDTALSLNANTTYWLQISSDALAWESRVGALGSNLAINNGGGWEIDDEEFVYTLLCEELGVSDLNSYDFAYYPNPVKDVLNISSQKGVKEVSIFNLAGQKVVNNAKLNQGQINLSSLTPGTYVFRVTLEGGQVETFKIVKK